MDKRTVGASVVTLTAVIVFAATAARALLFVPNGEVQVAETPQEGMSATTTVVAIQLPFRLRIPKLSIDAAVQSVGLTAKRAMAAPNNFTDVGWYKYGTVPGEKGSAVIAGHVDNGLALSGVFKHVSELSVGDDLYVDTKGGEAVHFTVVDIKSYPYKEVPTELLFNQNDAARLNLITCYGSWVKSAKTYDKRLVVFAKRV